MAVESNREMLAGVCSWLASRLGWNVWAIRAVLLILLIANPLWTALAYGAAAVLLGCLNRSDLRGKFFAGRSAKVETIASALQSPELAARKQRIEGLEQRFRDWEKSLPKD